MSQSFSGERERGTSRHLTGTLWLVVDLWGGSAHQHIAYYDSALTRSTLPALTAEGHCRGGPTQHTIFSQLIAPCDSERATLSLCAFSLSVLWKLRYLISLPVSEMSYSLCTTRRVKNNAGVQFKIALTWFSASVFFLVVKVTTISRTELERLEKRYGGQRSWQKGKATLLWKLSTESCYD